MRRKTRAAARRQRHRRVRRRVHGTATRPRLAVFRSVKHVYAQVIDDDSGLTLAAACSLENGMPSGDKSTHAREVGRRIAERAGARSIGSVVFDRGGFQYHGRVAAVASAAREGGLAF
jgi:large subunit ribosomal protein L18